MLALLDPLRHPEPMPQVLNIRHLPGFKERRPIIPPGAVYIGRVNSRYRLLASKWANSFGIRARLTSFAAGDNPTWLGANPS